MTTFTNPHERIEHLMEENERLQAQVHEGEQQYDRQGFRLHARIRELEAGLRLYGSHHTPCPKSPHHDGYDFHQRCTCGLDDLIAANRGGEHG